jgi:hypothetical protein
MNHKYTKKIKTVPFKCYKVKILRIAMKPHTNDIPTPLAIALIVVGILLTGNIQSL